MYADRLEWVFAKFRIRSYEWLSELLHLSTKERSDFDNGCPKVKETVRTKRVYAGLSTVAWLCPLQFLGIFVGTLISSPVADLSPGSWSSVSLRWSQFRRLHVCRQRWWIR